MNTKDSHQIKSKESFKKEKNKKNHKNDPKTINIIKV